MTLKAPDEVQSTLREQGKDNGAYVLEEQAGHLLRRVHQRHSAIFQAMIGDDQLTPLQFAALMKLADVGETSQNLLGRLTAMDAATMQGVIKRLSARGLIKRRPDKVDRRRLLLRLSKRGETLVGDLSHRGAAITNQTLDPLTISERKTFLKLLKRLSG